MPNTIQLHLLSNKQVKAEMQGIPLANDNAYRIIAGEENSTIFSITTKPTQYSAYDYYVVLVNSQGYKVPLDETEGTVVEGEDGQLLIGTSFTLPNGMAVAGYGGIKIYAKGTNEQGNNEKVVFQPIKVKVWNTKIDWQNGTQGGGGIYDFTEEQLAAINSGITADRRIAYSQHISIIRGNPHGTQKQHVGLGNVDNTSDIDKPISTATQAALNAKVNRIATIAGVEINDGIDAFTLTTNLAYCSINDIDELFE